MRKIHFTLVIFLGLSLLSCAGPEVGASKNDSESSPKTETEAKKILGEWVVVGDSVGRGDRGHLTLKSDGTFVSDYQISDGDGEFTNQGKTPVKTFKKYPLEKYSGTYKQGKLSLPTGDKTKYDFTVLIENGKPVQKTAEPSFFLMYDSETNMLHDMMTVAYARAGEEKKVQKQMEEMRKEK